MGKGKFARRWWRLLLVPCRRVVARDFGDAAAGGAGPVNNTQG
jgi:hypothetical protein